MFDLHGCLSFVLFLLSQFSSSDGQFSFPLTRFVLDLSSPLTQTKKKVETTFLFQVCRGFPDAMTTPPTLSWGSFLMNPVSTWWEPRLLLLCACCSKFRSVEVNQDPQWWQWLRRHRAGNSCCRWSACARYWLRCRAWAHDLCLEFRLDRWPDISTPRRSGTGGSSDSSQWCWWCGRSRQRTGRWKGNRRKRTRRNTQKRHDQRWNDFERHATLDNLQPHVQHEKNARVRACGEALSVHFVAFTPVATRWAWNLKKTARLQMESELRSILTTIETFSLANSFLRLFWAWICRRHSYLLSHHSLSCHPWECHSCHWWSQDDEFHHVGLGDQLEDNDEWLLAFWILRFRKVLHPVKTWTSGSIVLFWRVLDVNGI